MKSTECLPGPERHSPATTFTTGTGFPGPWVKASILILEGLLKDPAFQAMRADKQLDGSPWDYLKSDQVQAAFYKWSSARDQPSGIKQFYTAMSLENAGLSAQAIKAYQATVVHFPTAYAHTSWGSPWYVGPAAMDSVPWLIRHHPELKMRLKGGRVRIQHRYDDNPRNEIFEVDPGKIVAEPSPSQPAGRRSGLI